MDELLDRYTALTTLETIPCDYCFQLDKLAADFAADRRYGMAAVCANRAKHYQYKIVETHHVACGGEAVLYVTVAR